MGSILGREDPLEKEMATRYSCLENPMDIEDWWSTVYGVTKESDTAEPLNNYSQYLGADHYRGFLEHVMSELSLEEL